MVLRASKGRGVARVLRAARTGRARTVPVAAGPDHAKQPAPAAADIGPATTPLVLTLDGERGVHASARPSNRTEQLRMKALPMVNTHPDITPQAHARAWLMLEFPGLSRRVTDRVLAAYCDETGSLTDAYEAARARLLDACSTD
jgi:hypothetical protein